MIIEETIKGEITRIVNTNGIIVGEYYYDAYGNILNLDELSEIAEINPFRYKGYYYDQETNIYYCKSRYYSPEIYRWISRDEIEYLDTSSITGCNLYVYCNSNPVMGYDPNGNWDWGVFWTVVGFVVGSSSGIPGMEIYGAVIGNDAYQISEIQNNFDERVIIDEDSVEIVDSYKVISSVMKLGYAIYLNHFNSSTKDVIRGSSIGLEYEWYLHNIMFYLTFGKSQSARSVSVGRSIFSDNHSGGIYGIASNVMKVSYMMLHNPFFWIWDLIANGGYKGE